MLTCQRIESVCIQWLGKHDIYQYLLVPTTKLPQSLLSKEEISSYIRPNRVFKILKAH